MAELQQRLEDGEIAAMQPFGQWLATALRKARFDPDTGEAAWEQKSHRKPPLDREREAILDEYFDEIAIKRVHPTEGWFWIDDLPSLWTELV